MSIRVCGWVQWSSLPARFAYLESSRFPATREDGPRQIYLLYSLDQHRPQSRIEIHNRILPTHFSSASTEPRINVPEEYHPALGGSHFCPKAEADFQSSRPLA